MRIKQIVIPLLVILAASWSATSWADETKKTDVVERLGKVFQHLAGNHGSSRQGNP